jgi:hypothetical protein
MNKNIQPIIIAILVIMLAVTPYLFVRKKSIQAEHQKSKQIAVVVKTSRAKLYKRYDCETLIACYTMGRKEGVSCVQLHMTPEECR